MNEFLQYINPRLKDFVKYEFQRSYEYKVREQVIKHFQLKDINQLRDKFEGVAFLEKTYKRAISIWIVSKIFNTDLINLTDFEPQKISLNFVFNNKNWEIVIFEYGEIPKFNIKNEVNYILILRRDNNCFYYCGILEEENSYSENNKLNQRPVSFIEFEKLSIK